MLFLGALLLSGQYNRTLFHCIPLHLIPLLMRAYLLLFYTLWSHMLLSVPTALGGINKVACISVRIKITLHSNWIVQDSTRGKSLSHPGNVHLVFFGQCLLFY